MNKKIIIIVIAIILVGIAIFFVLKPEKNSSQNTFSGPVRMDNFNLFLQQQKVVQELPSSAILSLKLYNFDSGEREIDKEYVITKSKVVEGNSENADIEIMIHSKYISEIANNLCSTVEKAKSNNDFSASAKLSTSSLLWKYKSMLGYRNCFGF